jgi:hypothetical protein
MCGSRDKAIGREAIDMVSAFAVEAGLTLAQRLVNEKSNEITAIPFLLEMLALEEAVVTIDAIGCQTDIGYFVESAASAQRYPCFQPPLPKPRMSVSVSRGFPVAFC